MVTAKRSSGLAELGLGLVCYLAAGALSLPHLPPAAAITPSPKPAGERTQPNALVASYRLDARLDAVNHVVAGTGTIEWLNDSRAPVPSLFFHLYLNAFKNDDSVFLRSPFGASRDGTHAEKFGYIDVKSLKARELGGADLWPAHATHSPDDAKDETDIELPLPHAVNPGERLTLDVVFESRLPAIVERTGYQDSFHMVAQWFPKLAKLESDGHFAHFSFYPQSEFYADFGRYDVTLDVPENFVIGASGHRISQQIANGRRRERYLAEPVHDFAWTAWDGFVERKQRVQGVDVTVLSPAGHAATARTTLDAVDSGLAYFSTHFGSYPYDTLTVVHPPSGAEAAGGMEYPTLITTGAPWFSGYTGTRMLEAVTLHELGHQWFYGLLASNESASPFLDEGMNSFAELSVMHAAYGASSAANLFGLSLSETALFRAVSAGRAGDEPVSEAANQFSSFHNLGALVYSRTATILETAARVFGRERVDRALHAYAERFRFAHPTATDLLDSLRADLGADAARAIEQLLFERGQVNFTVRELQNARDQVPAGYFERKTGRELVPRSDDRAATYRGRVTVYRHGQVELPVEVLLIAKDGTQLLQHWDGRGPFHSFDYSGQSPLAFAQIDPQQKILVDDDLSDNQIAEHKAWPWAVNERVSYWAALALGGLGP